MSGGTALGALVGGIMDLGNGAINTNQNKKAQQRSFTMQKDLNVQAKDLALQQWKDTNYEAQRNELEKAGLNAGLLYGGGGGGGATTSTGSGGSAPSQAPASFNIGGMAMQGAQIAQQMKITEAQKDNIEANTNKTNIEASLLDPKTTADIEKTKQDAATGFQEEQIKNLDRQFLNDTMEARKEGTNLENKLRESGIQVQQGQINKMIQDIAQGWKGLDQQQQKIEIEKFKAELEAKYPTINKVGGGLLNNIVEALYMATGAPDIHKTMK